MDSFRWSRHIRYDILHKSMGIVLELQNDTTGSSESFNACENKSFVSSGILNQNFSRESIRYLNNRDRKITDSVLQTLSLSASIYLPHNHTEYPTVYVKKKCMISLYFPISWSTLPTPAMLVIPMGMNSQWWREVCQRRQVICRNMVNIRVWRPALRG